MAQNYKTAAKQQHELANLFQTNESIVWDLYCTEDSRELLSEKIKLLLSDDKQENQKALQIRETFVEAVYNQRKYSEGNLLTSLIFVLHTPSQCKPISNAKFCTNFSFHPLFRIRKCKKNYNSEECCMVFVDEFGRVYHDWDDFIYNNKLPQGTIVAPRKGLYKLDAYDDVMLECHLTPESNSRTKALKSIDYTAAGLGIGATLSLLIPPVAATAAVMYGCSAIGVGVGSWSIGRSSAHLADRGKHEQSISLRNVEARSSWIGIASGAVGIGAAGVIGKLSMLARSGKTVSPALEGFAMGINGLSIGINGICAAENIANVIMKKNDDEELTSMDIYNLSASLFLFTNSFHNFRTAKNLIKSINSTNNTFEYFRRAFFNINNETICNKISNLSKIIMAGKPLNNLKMDYIFTVKKIPNNVRTDNVLEIIEKIHNGNFELPPQNTRKISNSNNHSLIQKNNQYISPNIIYYFIDLLEIAKKSYYIESTGSLIDVIMNIAENYIHEILAKIFNMAGRFFEEIAPIVKNKFKTVIPFENILWVFYEVIKKKLHVSEEYLHQKTSEIIQSVRQYYRNLTKTNYNQEIKCEKCGGNYTITNI